MANISLSESQIIEGCRLTAQQGRTGPRVVEPCPQASRIVFKSCCRDKALATDLRKNAIHEAIANSI